MIFVTPSYKRAGNVKIRRLLPETVLAVHECERDQYSELEGGEIVVMPDDLRGNMAKVRNWILDNCDADLVMLDDDVSAIKYCEGGPKAINVPFESDSAGRMLWLYACVSAGARNHSLHSETGVHHIE